MLSIQNLSVGVGEKTILSDVSLSFELGKNYLLLWKNGSGKSSLAHFLMGNPKYVFQSGSVTMDADNLLSLSIQQRASAGLFVSFQNIPEIPWIGVGEYLRLIYNQSLKQKNPSARPISPFVFRRVIDPTLKALSIPEEFLSRELNVGFSGWEKRKMELLQVKLLNPKYLILDEIDSWLDINAAQTVSEIIASLSAPDRSIIVITHHFEIEKYLPFDHVYVLKNGTCVREWNLKILQEIKENGF